MKRIPNYLRAALALIAAALCVLSAKADRTTLAWDRLPGEAEATWFGTGSLERGMAYNPVTDHVYVVTRSGSPKVLILNADTGDQVMTTDETPVAKTLKMTGIAGGTFIINMIGVADDGVIYAANLVTTVSATAPFRIYRWDTEDSDPVKVYEGDPSQGAAGAIRWGDSFDVRGAGENTQLLAGSGASPYVAVFTTADGLFFSHTRIAGAATAAGSISVAFGAGNTIWSKRPANPLRQVEFNLADGTSTLLRSILFVASNDPVTTIDVSDDGKYLAAVWSSGDPRTARVYDISDPTSAPVLIGTQNFVSPFKANSNATGSADFGDGKVFVLDTNNGLVAMNLIQETTPVTINSFPDVNAFVSGNVTLQVSASGTTPIRYKWFFNGEEIQNQTSSTLVINNAQTTHTGEYRVEASNAANTAVDTAQLTVSEPLNGTVMTRIWRLLPTDRDYLAPAVPQQDARGIAINPVTGHVLVVSRTPSLAVHVLDAATGEPVMHEGAPLKLNIEGVTAGGTFPLVMIGVADDGVIYGSSLTTDASAAALKIYRWVNETAAPEVVYNANPSNGAQRDLDRRFGDTFDVRGAGVNTQILVTSRNGDYAAIIFPDVEEANRFATAIHVDDAPDASMGLGATFGEGNSFYATANGSAVRRITFEDPVPMVGTVIPGTVANVYGSADVPFSGSHLAYDAGSKLLAVTAFEIPNTVRLYRVNDDQTITLVDQELFTVDNTNGNGTGSLDFGANKLVALNTNRGVLGMSLNSSTPVNAANLNSPMFMNDGSFMFHFTGSPNVAYTVEVSTDLVQWAPVGNAITTDAGGNAMFTEMPPAGANYRFYRVVKR